MILYNKLKSANMFFLMKLFIFIIIFFGLFTKDGISQNSIYRKKSFFSTSYKKAHSLRRGIVVGLQSDVEGNAFVSLGYAQATWDAVNRRNTYWNISADINAYARYEEKMKFGIEATGYLSHIGIVSFPPFIYGASIQFLQDLYHGELYLRPEAGLMFPYRFKPKVDKEAQLVALLTYGYAFHMFNSGFQYSPHQITLHILISFKRWIEY